MNYSPLRYSGGKSKIAPLIRTIMQTSNNTHTTYIEPFAGGSGVALNLLLEGYVNHIVINDYDKAIYSFWRALKDDPWGFLELLDTTPLSIDEWQRQKEIYTAKNKRYSLELGFAAFYLNRTNRSGILSAGPIGGYAQTGSYDISARFNRAALTAKIQDIIAHRNQIDIYNKEVRSFIQRMIPQYRLITSGKRPTGKTTSYVNTEGMHALLPSAEVEVYKKKYKTSHKQFDKYFMFIEQAIKDQRKWLGMLYCT